jgi:hypothetical protein
MSEAKGATGITLSPGNRKARQVIAIFVEYALRTLTENSQLF